MEFLEKEKFFPSSLEMIIENCKRKNDQQVKETKEEEWENLNAT